MAKTWQEKFNSTKPFLIKTIEKRFADLPAGTKMLIATPKIIDAYINEIPLGMEVDLKTLRKDIALTHFADNACPVTTGIFLRVVSEVAFEKYQNNEDFSKITPFWRVINPKMPIAKKLRCGIDFIRQQREKEQLSF